MSAPTLTTGALPQVGMLASRVRTEERRILEAFERRGVECLHIDTRRLAGVAGAPEPGVDVALVREVGLARATYGASLLESRGVEVINCSEAIRLCGDKWETTRRLQRSGVPVPETTLAATPEAALAWMDERDAPVVVKPLVGSWGRRIGRLADRETAALVLEHVAALPSPQAHIVYLQELVADADADVRVLVVGGRAVAACRRRGEGLRKNAALGSYSEPYAPDPDTVRAAVEAARCVGAAVAGVDVLVHRHRGPLVLEVNAGVEFAGLQGTVDLDLADVIVDSVLERVAA